MELMRNGCRNFATRQNVTSALDACQSPRLDAGAFFWLARASLQAGRGRDEGLGAHRGSERPRHGRYERRGVRVRVGTTCTLGTARAHAEAQARAAASLPASLLASPKKFWGPEGQSECKRLPPPSDIATLQPKPVALAKTSLVIFRPTEILGVCLRAACKLFTDDFR